MSVKTVQIPQDVFLLIVRDYVLDLDLDQSERAHVRSALENKVNSMARREQYAIKHGIKGV